MTKSRSESASPRNAVEASKVSVESCVHSCLLLLPRQQVPNDSGPRQNVVLEAGFFIGKLGRPNVTVVVDGTRDAQAEYPSDMSGIVTVHYQAGGYWKMRLMRDFKASDLVFNAGLA